MTGHRMVAGVEMLVAASRHFNVPVRQMADRTRIPNLIRAVSVPAAATASGPMYPNATDKIAALGAAIMRERPFPAQHEALAILAMTLQAELSGVGWKGGRLVPGTRRVEQLVDHLSELGARTGRDHEDFTHWVRDNTTIIRGRRPPDTPRDRSPRVFIGHQDELVPEDRRPIFDQLSERVASLLHTIPGTLGRRWSATTIDPVMTGRELDLTAPGATWERDSALICESHGMIGVGMQASTGLAINHGWADALRLPVLTLLHGKAKGSVLQLERPSWQSMIDTWEDIEDIDILVHRYVQTYGDLLEDGWRHAQNEDLLRAAWWARATVGWRSLSTDERVHVAALAHLDVRAIELALRTVRTYRAVGSLTSALEEALGLAQAPMLRLPNTLIRLTGRQRRALADAARHMRWSTEEAARTEAQLLQSGSYHRAGFVRQEQWIDFHDRVRHGRRQN